MEIVFSNFKETFIELVKSSKEKIYLSSPYIKFNIAKLIIDNKKNNIDFRIMTKFTPSNLYHNSLDIEAIELFKINSWKIKNMSNLHAKIYIFDNNAIITSANLTNWWFYKNLEYWLLTKNNQNIVNDYLSLFNNKTYKFIKSNDIQIMNDILEKLVKHTKSTDIFDDDNESFYNMHENIEIVKSKLSKQNLIIFNCINEIWKQFFSTTDIYKYLHLFDWKTPENTIRRNLQELRDYWLIDFVSRWKYKKNWK